MDRRGFLSMGFGGGGARVLQRAGVAQPLEPLDLGDGVSIRPRASWSAGLAPPEAPLLPEEPRFLLVHHSVTPNDYASDSVPVLLRQVHALHTGPEKGWPDVAYNFFVDRFGGVWEGRTGSLDGPVRGDATGGNQGYSQLCCFVGDHQVSPPTLEAQTAMAHLLAFLGERYQIDTAPRASTSFVSLGSNRWPPGAEVSTTTIAGHRDMSQTECPGDATYSLVRDSFPEQVTAIRIGRALASAATTTTPSSPGTSQTPRRESASPPRPGHQRNRWRAEILVPAASVGGLALAAAMAVRLRLLGRSRRQT